jgi:hypothetical protein
MLVLAVESDLPEARRAAARAIEGQRLTFDQIDILSQDVLPDWHEDWAIEAYEEFRLIRVQTLEAACTGHSRRTAITRWPCRPVRPLASPNRFGNPRRRH